MTNRLSQLLFCHGIYLMPDVRNQVPQRSFSLVAKSCNTFQINVTLHRRSWEVLKAKRTCKKATPERKHSHEWWTSFAVGHLALGYLSGKATSKLFKVNVNIPLLFLISVLPDFDLLVPFIEHRGPFHSILITTIVFLPIFLFFRKRAAPYYVALIQHSIIGDYLTDGGVQLLWPIARDWYAIPIPQESLISISLEWILFLISFIVMVGTNDIRILLKDRLSNLTFVVPIPAILFPAFLGHPLPAPLELFIPHLIYLALFTLSILATVKTRHGSRF